MADRADKGKLVARTRAPDYLPDDLLRRSDFAAACDARDLGALFRVVIKWGGPGCTRSHLARRCEMSVGRVRDYINDLVEAQSLEVWERVSDGLHIPGAMLGISQRPWENADDITAQPEDRKSVESQREWIRTRQLLNQRRRELTQVARSLYPESVQLGQTGFLAPSYWLLNTPVDLSSVDVELTNTPPPSVTGKQAETLPLRPLIAPGKHYDTYHRAMRDLNRPRLFENRICYRLLDAQWSATGGKLSLGYMRYFDMIDLGEQLVHELARAEIDERGNMKQEAPTWNRLPFRSRETAKSFMRFEAA